MNLDTSSEGEPLQQRRDVRLNDISCRFRINCDATRDDLPLRLTLVSPILWEKKIRALTPHQRAPNDSHDDIPNTGTVGKPLRKHERRMRFALCTLPSRMLGGQSRRAPSMMK